MNIPRAWLIFLVVVASLAAVLAPRYFPWLMVLGAGATVLLRRPRPTLWPWLPDRALAGVLAGLALWSAFGFGYPGPAGVTEGARWIGSVVATAFVLSGVLLIGTLQQFRAFEVRGVLASLGIAYAGLLVLSAARLVGLEEGWGASGGALAALPGCGGPGTLHREALLLAALFPFVGHALLHATGRRVVPASVAGLAGLLLWAGGGLVALAALLAGTATMVLTANGPRRAIPWVLGGIGGGLWLASPLFGIPCPGSPSAAVSAPWLPDPWLTEAQGMLPATLAATAWLLAAWCIARRGCERGADVTLNGAFAAWTVLMVAGRPALDGWLSALLVFSAALAGMVAHTRPPVPTRADTVPAQGGC